MTTKIGIKEFWEEASCGEKLYLEETDLGGFREQCKTRYQLEPFIVPFADFDGGRGKQVLEVGVGVGADHQKFAEAGAILYGVDLTERAIKLTSRRFELLGLNSDLRVGDAENLDFPDNSFDIVYAWGVIHHTPDTQKAVNEIFRILKPGGICKVMIYHRYSLVGFMLWIRYALLAGRPFTPLDAIYARHLESPGTKAYSESQARELFSQFSHVSVCIQLCHGDLLASVAGQRHEGSWLALARLIWPRWFFRQFCRRNGLFMLIHATKPTG